MGNPDRDITIKPTPEYFKHFCTRYGFYVQDIKYTLPENQGIFEKISKIVPSMFIYPPLFYPQYILILKKNSLLKI